MGWWWSSTPAKSDQQTTPSSPSPSPSSSSTPSQSPSGTIPSTSTTQQQPPQQPPTITREEQADAELNSFLASLQADISTTSQQPNSSSTSESTPSTTSTTTTEQSSSPTISIAPESLYPSTLSCRTAFDYAFFCQSFGGQFVNVYRYGELRSCSEHWEKFWLCMKARALPEKQSREMVRDYFRRKAVKYKTGPSSEDVWEVRTEPVRGAFEGDFGEVEREMKMEEEKMETEMREMGRKESAV